MLNDKTESSRISFHSTEFSQIVVHVHLLGSYFIQSVVGHIHLLGYYFTSVSSWFSLSLFPAPKPDFEVVFFVHWLFYTLHPWR